MDNDTRGAARYDRMIAPLERYVLGVHRPWVGERAHGATLEVAVGTGANLPHYGPGVELTALELDPGMLALARVKARRLGRGVRFVEGDAQRLPFADAEFDTAVMTLALCGVPDNRAALAELCRVLRPGGSLLLVDHVGSTSRAVSAAQRLLESVTIRTNGEYFTRRQLPIVEELGLTVVESGRFNLGVIERLHARKPA